MAARPALSYWRTRPVACEVPTMRRALLSLIAAALLLAATAPAALAAPANPSATGECAAETARERMGKPEDPSFSFPFECPPPPPFRGEAP
jgi:hypothetical protein